MRATVRGLGDAAGASLRRRMTLYVTAQLLAMIDAWAGADSHWQTRLHGQRFTARKLAISDDGQGYDATERAVRWMNS